VAAELDGKAGGDGDGAAAAAAAAASGQCLNQSDWFLGDGVVDKVAASSGGARRLVFARELET
jgi:hypothetical protein